MLLRAFRGYLNSQKVIKPTYPPSLSHPPKHNNNSHNKDVPIEKILKLTSTKKFDTAKDVVFCSSIFQLIGNNSSINANNSVQLQKQISRMLNNSLKYLHELSLAESLLLSDRVLNFVNMQKVQINQGLLINFIEIINKNIETAGEKKIQGWFYEGANYVKKLTVSKIPAQLVNQITKYLMKKVQNQNQVIEMIKVFLSFKFKNRAFLQQTVQVFLEKYIGSRIIDLPLSSPLIDEIVLQLFLQYKLQLKQPYNCFPTWIFTLIRKLQQKHMDKNIIIPITKRFGLLNTFSVFLNNLTIISQRQSTMSKDFTFLVEYFLRVSQIFGCLDDCKIEIKTQLYLKFLFNFTITLSNHCIYDNEAVAFGVDFAMTNIYDHYISRMTHEITNNQIQNQINTLVNYCYYFQYFLEKNQGKKNQLADYQMKLFKKLVSLFNGFFQKSKNNIQFSCKYFLILPYIVALGKNDNFSIFNLIEKQVYSLLEKCQKWIIDLQQDSLQHICSSSPFKVNVPTLLRLSMLYASYPFSDKFNEIYEQFEGKNLTFTIETTVNTHLIRSQKIRMESLRLSKILAVKIQNSINQTETTPKQFIQISNSSLKFSAYEEQLASNFIVIFKNSFPIQIPLNSSLYNYWFIERSQIIKEVFNHINLKHNYYWNMLSFSLRFSHQTCSASAIDIISEIMRIYYSPTERSYDKFVALFNEGSIYSLMFHKTDMISQVKYNWIICFLYKVRPNMMVDLRVFDKKKKENVAFSLNRLIQLITFLCQNISPLSIGDFRSQLACKSINNLVGSIQTNNKALLNKTYLSQIPFQQFIFFLMEQNPLQQPFWMKIIRPDILLNSFTQKYTRILQYNILLYFNAQNTATQSAHNKFISDEMSLYQFDEKDDDNVSIYQSTVLKFYFYLVQPCRSQDNITKCLQLLKDQIAISNDEVLNYWLCKGIVMKTVDDRLISSMLERLFKIPNQLTQIQFSTIINTIITLFKKQRVRDYKIKGRKQQITLRNWINSQLNILVEPNPKGYLLDYFTLIHHSLIDPITTIQDQIQSLITFEFKRNNFYIIDHFYKNKYQLSKQKFNQLKSMFVVCKQRGLFQDYFNLMENCQFRVGLFLIRAWAIALQHDSQNNSLQWFVDEIMNFFVCQNVINYFLKQEKNSELYLVIKRFRITEKKMNSTKLESPAFEIIRKLAEKYENLMEINISQNQKRLSNKEKQGKQIDFELVRIPKSQLNLMRQRSTGKMVYFLEGQLSSAQEQIQLLYITLQAGPELQILVRPRLNSDLV